MARLGEPTYLPSVSDWREHEAAYDELYAGQPTTGVVGCLVNFQVADGFAVYLVTSESPLTLSHVEWADGYTIPDAHIRGLNLSDVTEMVENRRDIARLFGGG
jgi:hypothetical protein